MYYEESVLTGGLGIWLVIGIFAVTTVIGIGVFFWYLQGQKEAKRKLAEAPTETPTSTPVQTPTQVSAKVPSKVSPEAPANVPAAATVSAALGKTRASLFGRIQNLFGGKQTLSDTEREELEELDVAF